MAAPNAEAAALDARNRELAGATTLRINWLTDRAAQYKQQAEDNFRGNNIALAYRLLGQADEALQVVRELHLLRYQIYTGEELATAS